MKVKLLAGLILILVSLLAAFGCGGGGARTLPPIAPDASEPVNPPNPYHWTPARGFEVEGGEAYAEVCELLGAPDIRELGLNALDESGFPLREYASPPYSGAVQRSPPDPHTEYPEEPLSLEIALVPATWTTYIFPLPSRFGMGWVPDTGNGWAFGAILWRTTPSPYHWPEPFTTSSYGARVVYINGVVYMRVFGALIAHPFTVGGIPSPWQLSGKKLVSLMPGYSGELERE